MNYCKCFHCEDESTDDSDPDEEVPIPPGVIPLQNEGKEQERVPVQTPSASRKQLFAMTGWNVAIYPSMKVRGTREHYSVFAILDVRAVGKGEVQMRGVESGLYLAMSNKGRLYGEYKNLYFL
ncbi:Fibroblast growth factor 20 [Armadillidium nasatum]|uniref:Fibroblast growth factor n=1 Tax=Armadillidium nasatum TaxID=96803 RepID=A0A5N5THQ2_9CRUS|nr:Fibroblast growth factor 20 [Armadillidium nasatum]